MHDSNLGMLAQEACVAGKLVLGLASPKISMRPQRYKELEKETQGRPFPSL
jgi:hypothetical protein